MNRSSNNDIFGILSLVGLVLLASFAVWIMRTFGVPFAIATESGFKIVVWGLAAIGVVIWNNYTDFNVIKFTAPLMASLFWCTLFPVLDYHAGIRKDFPVQVDISWYGTGFWQFFIFLIINVVGYGIIYYLHRRGRYYY
ncbi:hypothetical protein [Escherichia albertii]|uniref:hypothetical protein n=1 Tax=Escherichia albertii TaxID=208962 RepID=UPI001F1AACC0|nr:hypothetical protein [Escherichia albertii]